MRRTARRWMTVVAVALGLLAGAAAMPGIQVAMAAEDCAGVWVVVDARAAGGSATTRCVPGDPGSGFEALSGAGHTYSFVPRIPGMVCVLDGRPDPCNGAPADAYWSYWHAEVGGSWTYATRGAADRDPAPGEVEGWAFGAGDPPSVPPPSAPAAVDPDPEPEPEAEPAPDPEPQADPEPGPEPQDEGAGQDTDARSGGGSADTSSPESSDASDDPESLAEDEAREEGDGTGTALDDDATESAAQDDGDEGDGEVAEALATSAEEGGSIAGIVSAGALIVVLASGAAWQSSRRRRA